MLALVQSCMEVPKTSSVASSAGHVVAFTEQTVRNVARNYQVGSSIGSVASGHDWSRGGVLADVAVEVPAPGIVTASTDGVVCSAH